MLLLHTSQKRIIKVVFAANEVPKQRPVSLLSPHFFLFGVGYLTPVHSGWSCQLNEPVNRPSQAKPSQAKLTRPNWKPKLWYHKCAN